MDHYLSDPGMYYWTKDIIIDPNDATQNTWYAGVFDGWGGAPNGLGGLYKTTNRGQSWTRINETPRVTSITFNPNDTKQVFMTSEYSGLQVCQDITLTNPVFELVNNYPFEHPERVFFNPYNANEIWISSFGSGMKMGDMTSTQVNNLLPEDNNITIEPNPSNGFFKLNVADLKSGSYVINIFNSSGKLVYKSEISNSLTDINLSHLKEGVYFSQIIFKDKINTKKIVIIK